MRARCCIPQFLIFDRISTHPWLNEARVEAIAVKNRPEGTALLFTQEACSYVLWCGCWFVCILVRRKPNCVIFSGCQGSCGSCRSTSSSRPLARLWLGTMMLITWRRCSEGCILNSRCISDGGFSIRGADQTGACWARAVYLTSAFTI